MKKSLAAFGICALLATSGAVAQQSTGAGGSISAAPASYSQRYSLTDQQPAGQQEVAPQSATPVQVAPTTVVGQNWANSSCCQSSCNSPRFSIPLRSEGCFDDFISPISNPVFFEDPRNVTEARFIFLNHTVPAGLGGGDVQLYALQLRARLSENVSLIATKDGFGTSSNPLLDDGWADIAAGLKFALLRNPQNQSLLSGGFTFEVPTGSERMLQGNGDGELNLFLTGGKRLSCSNFWVSTTGFRFPMNHDDESEVFYWSNHLSHQITRRFYALTEFNWYHWMRAGTNGVPGIEGLDLFNLGSSGVAGNDIVTQAVGVKLKPHRQSEIGVAYEFPLTDRKDIIENRLNFNWIFRY